MRRLGLVAGFLLLAGVLAACQLTITYSPPPTYTSIPANATAPSNPTATDTLAGHETVDYRVSMAAISDPLFHAEADGPVTVLVMDSGGRPLVSSSSSAYFQSGTSALSVSSAGSPPAVTPSTVTVSDTCTGPCALVRASDSYYYVEVTNTSSTSANVDLYFYGAIYGDEYETANNSLSGTNASLGNSGGDSGAIETIGDVDYWYIGYSGTWDFSATSSTIDPVVYVLDANGNRRYGPYYGGDTVPAYAGWYYQVLSSSGYAGVAGKSSYSFSNFQ